MAFPYVFTPKAKAAPFRLNNIDTPLADHHLLKIFIFTSATLKSTMPLLNLGMQSCV
jgi:hypothetical protein